MLEKPFYRGDVIDISGVQGKVEDISIRSTRVKTIDGKVITVPNSTFTTNSVINYSKSGRLQVKIQITFPPDNEAFVELDNFSSRLFSFPAKLSNYC